MEDATKVTKKSLSYGDNINCFILRNSQIEAYLNSNHESTLSNCFNFMNYRN